MEADSLRRKQLMTLVVVGGGPTGVEMAGAIADMARFALSKDRRIDPRTAQIVLVEAGQRLLPAFPESLSAYASRSLKQMGVDVRLSVSVTACEKDRSRRLAGSLQPPP